MTEKDFRRLVTDLEISKEEKEKLHTILTNLESTLSNNLSKHFELVNVLKGGAWAKGTMMADTDEIDILVVLKSNLNKDSNLVNNACLNEIENIIIYEYTVNRPNSAQKSLDRGLHGFYTDCLRTEDLQFE